MKLATPPPLACGLDFFTQNFKRVMMGHFEFEYPYAFILLLLIICIYKCPYNLNKIFFPHLHLFSKFSNWLNKEKLLYSLILTLLITALASPISYDSKSSNHRKGRDIVFVLDSSGSMGESGYDKNNPDKSKFEILKSIIKNFITHRFDDNVGVTVFGSYAFSSVPITYDMGAVSFLLDFLDVGMAGENTAIGDGIAFGSKLLKNAHAKNKVMILVTDGYQNSGQTSIKKAVKEAKQLNIKIYTLGISKNNDFDKKLLQKIALETDAKMFQANDAKQLNAVYQELNLLEPSKIHSQNYLNKEMLFTYPLALAILLILYIITRKRELS